MNRKKAEKAIAVILLAVLAVMQPVQAKGDLWDQWEQAHGISIVRIPDKGYNVLWSDAYATGTTASGDWTHDVFGLMLRKRENSEKYEAVGEVQKLVSAKEAQEPASAARTTDGHILVTFEDGNATKDYGIMQRYAILDDELKAVVPYNVNKTILAKGGHSGHATAMGNTFLTVWDGGWSDDDGVNGHGTGEDIYLTTMRSTGTGKKTKKVADSSARYDWPVVAASKNKALILWQRIVPGKNYTRLMLASYDGKTEKLSGKKTVAKLRCKYYHYGVTYVPSVKRFVVTATDRKGIGHVYLYTASGKLVAHKSGFGKFFIESTPAVSNKSLVYPTGKNSLTGIKVTAKTIKKWKTVKNVLTWSGRGQAGYVDANKAVVFYCLQSGKLKRGETTLFRKGL